VPALQVIFRSTTAGAAASAASNADNLDVLLGNYNGYPSKYVTVLQGIKNKVGSHTRILYEPGCGLVDQIPLEPVPSDYFILPEAGSGEKGLKAEYFADTSLSGKPVIRKPLKASTRTGIMQVQLTACRWTFFQSVGRVI
jgi:beta-glucosidase